MNKGILLSGGLDSIALAYLIRPDIAFTIDYGQKPAKTEISVSDKICKLLNIHHEVITVDCTCLGSGDLSNNKTLAIAPSTEWWPYRNQLLITLACMKGIAMDISELALGSVKTDSFHKDGTNSFYDKINDLMQYQEGNIKVTCPSIHMMSTELITMSKVPMEILLWGHSCHTANIPCGICPGCLKHLRVKQDLGLDIESSENQ
ncbi:MAG: 7-cyano-7-deazaguanine synthase [Sphingobacteriales bacterium]|nr:7-cyano-7-deazaguanine synthase [Sphingobacteriales bacterium]